MNKRHVDYFKEFFKNNKGTAKKVCEYLVLNHASFNCCDEFREKSINKHLYSELGKQYPSGILNRVKNEKSIFEYYTE